MKTTRRHSNTRLLLFTLFALCGDALAADTWVAVGHGGGRIISSACVKWEITAEWAEKGGDDSNHLMGIPSRVGPDFRHATGDSVLEK